MMQLTPLEQRVVHIRYAGQSHDLAFRLLDLGAQSDERAIRYALARYLNIPLAKLAPYVVEQHTNGNVTVRPEAVFG